MTEQEMQDIINVATRMVLERLGTFSIHPSQITAKLIKGRHIDGMIIVRGLAADLPTDDSTGVQAYYATDTDVLYIYDGSAWNAH